MNKSRPTHLRDVDRDCLARFNTTGRPMICQLPAGHDGMHKHDCTRWSSAHNMPSSKDSR